MYTIQRIHTVQCRAKHNALQVNKSNRRNSRKKKNNNNTGEFFAQNLSFFFLSLLILYTFFFFFFVPFSIHTIAHNVDYTAYITHTRTLTIETSIRFTRENAPMGRAGGRGRPRVCVYIVRPR